MREHQESHDHNEDLSPSRSSYQEPSADELRALTSARPDALTPDGALRMQEYAGNTAVAHSIQRSKVKEVVDRPNGIAIPPDIVNIVESTYGPMPSDSRMHTDSEALDSAREVDAYAYASGRDIVIPEDAPREVQLEEAFHLAQQNAHDDVASNDVGNGLLVSDNDDAYEREAQYLAREHVHR